jgi:hypothetical protein
MNRLLLILITLFITAQTVQAGFRWSDTLVSPLVGYRLFSDPDHYGNSFVVGGHLRQRITKELSLQARGGLMRRRDEGYQKKITNQPASKTRFISDLEFAPKQKPPSQNQASLPM